MLEDKLFIIMMGTRKRKYVKWKMNAPMSMKKKGKKMLNTYHFSCTQNNGIHGSKM